MTDLDVKLFKSSLFLNIFEKNICMLLHCSINSYRQRDRETERQRDRETDRHTHTHHPHLLVQLSSSTNLQILDTIDENENMNHQEDTLKYIFFVYLSFFFLSFFKLGFTSCKAKQPLQGMELQEKETQKD